MRTVLSLAIAALLLGACASSGTPTTPASTPGVPATATAVPRTAGTAAPAPSAMPSDDPYGYGY